MAMIERETYSGLRWAEDCIQLDSEPPCWYIKKGSFEFAGRSFIDAQAWESVKCRFGHTSTCCGTKDPQLRI